MTPEERQLVDDLFDRLAKLEVHAARSGRRARDRRRPQARAECGLRAGADGAGAGRGARRADARIRELSEGGEQQPQQGGRLPRHDAQRLRRRRAHVRCRACVPARRRGGGPDPRWNQGGSHAGCRCSAWLCPGAAAMLPLRAMAAARFSAPPRRRRRHDRRRAAAEFDRLDVRPSRRRQRVCLDAAGDRPGTTSAAGSDLAREAGAGDVGGSRQSALDDQGGGLFGDSNVDPTALDDDPGGSDFGDLGGGDDSA